LADAADSFGRADGRVACRRAGAAISAYYPIFPIAFIAAHDSAGRIIGKEKRSHQAGGRRLFLFAHRPTNERVD
jgi:hypothetical protein